MDDMYRDYILDHYKNPRNFGELEGATHTYHDSNPLCGDEMTMQLRIGDGHVDDVHFTGKGCAISQASASILTEEIKGKTLDENGGLVLTADSWLALPKIAAMKEVTDFDMRYAQKLYGPMIAGASAQDMAAAAAL